MPDVQLLDQDSADLLYRYNPAIVTFKVSEKAVADVKHTVETLRAKFRTRFNNIYNDITFHGND